MANPSDLRARLVRALEADVIGPFDPETGEEVLRLPPSRWYLTGFLAPQGGREPVELQDPTAEEELGTEIDHDEESGGTERETEPKQKDRLPASMGLSVLLPPEPATDTVRVRVTWAEYQPEDGEADEGRRPKRVWRRVKRPPVSLEVPLDAKRIAAGVAVTADGSTSRESWRRWTFPARGRAPWRSSWSTAASLFPAAPRMSDAFFRRAWRLPARKGSSPAPIARTAARPTGMPGWPISISATAASMRWGTASPWPPIFQRKADRSRRCGRPGFPEPWCPG